MIRVARRSYTRQPRTSWFLLLSVLLHLLVIAALNLPLRIWQDWRPEQKEQKQNPIRVSFVRPENPEEPEKPEVFAETSSRAQTPEGPKAEVAKDTQAVLPEARHTPAEPSPPSEAQVHEEPQPQVSPPPIPVTPQPAPEATPKPAPSPPRHQETAKETTQSPPKPERKLPEPPEPRRMAKPPERAERTPPRPPQEPTPQTRSAKVSESAEPKRMARLPEPAESTPPRPAPEPTPQTRSALESPQLSEQRMLPRLGRVPLLSGEDLEKYAHIRSSDQQSSSGDGVALDTKELKYLSYFAHIKRRIEQAWRYPPDAIANGLQGQLHLKFVLRSNGQVKTVELLRSSGYKVLDKEAWDAVVNAAPFGAFPPTIPDDELHITARFTYVLDETAQRTRMR
jgi:periplasmic protein TonB